MHHEIWPSIPQIYHIKKDDFAIDLLMQKFTSQKDNENCKPEPYEYFGNYAIDTQHGVTKKGMKSISFPIINWYPFIFN